MAPKNRVIIDTDPGCDDVLALLLALSASSEELEVLLISITHGNVDAQTCLRNAVATFHVLDKELVWRKEKGLPLGFDGITKYRPILAVGAERPLHEGSDTADYFHGRDGLAGSHTTHPHFTPEDGWADLFDVNTSKELNKATQEEGVETTTPSRSFVPSVEKSHKEILRLLRENEPDTISLISMGPLTNFAIAAAEDPETFVRAKQVVIMGGAVDLCGNVTPVAEFNVFADAVAAARVFALSSRIPSSTMPDVAAVTSAGTELPPYTPKPGSSLSRQLKIVLMSLDLTESHTLTRKEFKSFAEPLAAQGSPLAQWLSAFMIPMFDKMDFLHTGHEGDSAAFSLHDPMTVYYVLMSDRDGWSASPKSPEDIRVEVSGQWTNGMTVGDRRPRKRRNSDGEAPHDRGNWLGNQSGNRIWRMLQSPNRETTGVEMMERILGVRKE